MTENDNIRHYIGSLEATEDIDVMFKHIYDLMLANGGEGSGLNADMLDGYHASDFAPASLKDEMDYSIQEIIINGRSYNKGEPLEIQISDIINDGKTDYATAQFNTLEKIINNIKSSIEDLDEREQDSSDRLDEVSNISRFLDTEDIRNALTALKENNLKIIDTAEGQRYYLDADSINGISLQVVTQEMYDNLANDIKLDPRNVFIINNDIGEAIDDGEYMPPSILQAGINLQFDVDEETNNLVYSIDGRTWKEAVDIVGTENNKGLLYPTRFTLVKDAIDEDNLELNQADYPFLLNSDDAKTELSNELQTLDEYKIGGITIGSNSITPTSSTTNVDITATLDNYLSNWAQNQTNANTLKTQLGITNLSQTVNTINSDYERSSRKSQFITGAGTTTNYPSTKATVDYINPIQSSLQNQINSLRELLTLKIASAPAYTNFFSGTVYFRKIGGWVFVTASVTTKTTVDYIGVTDYWNFCMIPSGFEPNDTCNVVAQCSMTDRCYIFFRPNGAALIGRFDYNNKRTGTYTLPKNYWITMSTSYPAKYP